MAHAFFLGVDFAEDESGEQTGATLTILEKEQENSDAEVSYRLDHIRHFDNVDSIDELADHIQSLVAERPYIGRTSIVINRSTEPGQALVDALSNRGLDPVAATLTEGSGAVSGSTDEVGVHLGTADAVQTLAELYRNRQFGIDDYSSEDASALARGVQRAAEVLDEQAGSAREQLVDVGTHVTSASLAAWFGAERSFDPTQHLKENPQTGRGGPEGA